MLQTGVSHRYVRVKQGTKKGGVAPCWGTAGMAEKTLRAIGGIAAILSLMAQRFKKNKQSRLNCDPAARS